MQGIESLVEQSMPQNLVLPHFAAVPSVLCKYAAYAWDGGASCLDRNSIVFVT